MAGAGSQPRSAGLQRSQKDAEEEREVTLDLLSPPHDIWVRGSHGWKLLSLKSCCLHVVLPLLPSPVTLPFGVCTMSTVTESPGLCPMSMCVLIDPFHSENVPIWTIYVLNVRFLIGGRPHYFLTYNILGTKVLGRSGFRSGPATCSL